MADTQFNLVKNLQDLFPQLSAAQARNILVNHKWDLESSLEDAESFAAKASNERPKTENYCVGRDDRRSTQQDDASHTNTSAPDNCDDVGKLLESLFSQVSGGYDDKDKGSAPLNAFYGRGRRLGHTEQPSPYIASTLRQRRDVSITLYRNGIFVDNGIFITMNSPEGKEFLEAMRQGYIPSSLQSHYPDCELNVTLLDHLELDYKPASLTAFKGEGHRLTTDEGKTSTSGERLSFDTSRNFHFEPSEDASFICILNTQGERREFKVNPSRHTVEDVYYLAHSLQPDLERFVLVVRSMPPYKLENLTRSQTIEEAKLCRAVVTIRPL
ncbi:unnamed protein product [Phytomonas sp. EM1]|nr:unnamed protein product [Phytomonas sp. EM1]|eukprot:CCW61923.1 unnamed protein product [Phytomonas sp. isolate EM1]